MNCTNLYCPYKLVQFIFFINLFSNIKLILLYLKTPHSGIAAFFRSLNAGTIIETGSSIETPEETGLDWHDCGLNLYEQADEYFEDCGHAIERVLGIIPRNK